MLWFPIYPIQYDWSRQSDKKEDIIDFINGWMSKVKKKRLENAEEWYNRTIARKKSRTLPQKT